MNAKEKINEKDISNKVDTNHLGVEDEFVCWIDMMGTQKMMSESLQKATNHLFRFHSCILAALGKNKSVKYYPLMDGIFLTCKDNKTLFNVINKIFKHVSDIFVSEEVLSKCFIIRGSISYGKVYHGINISEDICKKLSTNNDYKKTLMVGMPITQAYISERYAPPFGLYIHESARIYKGLQGRYYKWFGDYEGAVELKNKICNYFEFCGKFRKYLELEQDKINEYKQLVDEQFSDYENFTADNLSKK